MALQQKVVDRRASIHAAMQHSIALKQGLGMSKGRKGVVDPRVRI
jgi:hypothetical protein